MNWRPLCLCVLFSIQNSVLFHMDYEYRCLGNMKREKCRASAFVIIRGCVLMSTRSG